MAGKTTSQDDLIRSRIGEDAKAEFLKALRRGGDTNQSKALRALVEAYSRFVKKHGRQPDFPFTIQP